jgi:hypothetical protein
MKRLKSRKLWITIGTAIVGGLIPEAAPLLTKLAALYIPVQGAVDVAGAVVEAIDKVRQGKPSGR